MMAKLKKKNQTSQAQHTPTLKRPEDSFLKRMLLLTAANPGDDVRNRVTMETAGSQFSRVEAAFRQNKAGRSR